MRNITRLPENRWKLPKRRGRERDVCDQAALPRRLLIIVLETATTSRLRLASLAVEQRHESRSGRLDLCGLIHGRSRTSCVTIVDDSTANR